MVLVNQNGAEDEEHIGVSFVEIANIFATHGDFVTA